MTEYKPDPLAPYINSDGKAFNEDKIGAFMPMVVGVLILLIAAVAWVIGTAASLMTGA